MVTISSKRGTPVSVVQASISRLVRDGSFERRTTGECGGLHEHEVVVDCSGIETICSEDLNTLIQFHSRLRRESSLLVLANVPEHLARIFTLTRLDRLFAVEEAVSASIDDKGRALA